jgi:hypothetical protein
MIEANEALGFDADCRDFSLAVAVMHELKGPAGPPDVKQPAKS